MGRRRIQCGLLTAVRFALTVRRRTSAFWMVVVALALAVALAGCGSAGREPFRSPRDEPTAVVSGGCFSHPGRCGYPDPVAGNVGPTSPCASYPVLPGMITSSDGQVIDNTTFTGQIQVTTNNVTIRNVCVLMDGHGRADGTSGISIKSGSGTTIENTTIAGLDTSTRSLDWGVVNTSGQAATLSHDYIYNCGECIHDGPWNIDGSYAIANGMQGTGEHIETIYCDSGPGYTDTINANHDTLLNPASSVAVLFCNTHNGAGGPCANQITVTDSLLAGGGYLIYPCSSASSVGSSRLSFSDNRIARCTTPPLQYSTTDGGTACAGSSTHAIGDGVDSHGYWAKGGYYGVTAYGYCPPIPGQTWSANVWDDDGAPVSC